MNVTVKKDYILDELLKINRIKSWAREKGSLNEPIITNTHQLTFFNEEGNLKGAQGVLYTTTLKWTIRNENDETADFTITVKCECFDFRDSVWIEYQDSLGHEIKEYNNSTSRNVKLQLLLYYLYSSSIEIDEHTKELTLSKNPAIVCKVLKETLTHFGFVNNRTLQNYLELENLLDKTQIFNEYIVKDQRLFSILSKSEQDLDDTIEYVENDYGDDIIKLKINNVISIDINLCELFESK